MFPFGLFITNGVSFSLIIKLIGNLVEDHKVLSDLGITAGQTVEVEIQSSDPMNKPLHFQQKPHIICKLPEKVNVKVERGNYKI